MPDLIRTLVPVLTPVTGVLAVVLGGSRARGTALPGSDYDIGIYYDPATPLDIAALQQALTGLTDQTPELTAPGDWGPWINGGGWVQIAGQKVDILYRDLTAVAAALRDAHAGRLTCHYQPGHPFGLTSAQGLGELALCRILSDPTGRLAQIQAQSAYPAALQQAVIRHFLWETGFTIAAADKATARGDMTYLAGSAFRALGCICQVLFALNARYLITEKRALAEAATLPLHLDDLLARAQSVWACVGQGDATGALALLWACNHDLNALLKGQTC